MIVTNINFRPLTSSNITLQIRWKDLFSKPNVDCGNSEQSLSAWSRVVSTIPPQGGWRIIAEISIPVAINEEQWFVILEFIDDKSMNLQFCTCPYY